MEEFQEYDYIDRIAEIEEDFDMRYSSVGRAPDSDLGCRMFPSQSSESQAWHPLDACDPATVDLDM